MTVLHKTTYFPGFVVPHNNLANKTPICTKKTRYSGLHLSRIGINSYLFSMYIATAIPSSFSTDEGLVCQIMW